MKESLFNSNCSNIGFIRKSLIDKIDELVELEDLDFEYSEDFKSKVIDVFNIKNLNQPNIFKDENTIEYDEDTKEIYLNGKSLNDIIQYITIYLK